MVKMKSTLNELDKVIEGLKTDKISIQKAQTIVNAADKELKAYALYLAACKTNGTKPEMQILDLK